MIEALINMVLLTLLAAIMVGVVRLTNLFAVVILASAYSFLIATVLVVLDAVDVAMTEAAVGAGVSTVLMLAVLFLTKTGSPKPRHSPVVPLFVSTVTGLALIYGTLDLPHFGTKDAPEHQHVAPYYLENSVPQTGIPNVVSSVLASYRGFDTLGETTVVFTAGIGVLLLLRRNRRNNDGEGESI